MTMNDFRLTDLEIQHAHLARTVDELNEVVAKQAREIDVLKRRVEMVMQRLASDEASTDGTIPLADQPPPHW